MSLSSALRKALAPSLLALMTAFAPAANAADAATMKYDPARGVIAGDKYTREEASKFVCLNKDPSKGDVSEACGKPAAHEIGYIAKKGDNTLILTKEFLTNTGLVLEKGGSDFAVQMKVRDMHFDAIGNVPRDSAGNIVVPAWADPKIVAPNSSEVLAIRDCQNEAGCAFYVNRLSYTYNQGGSFVAGGRIDAGQGSSYFMFRVSKSGMVGSIDIVTPTGASRYGGTYTGVVGSLAVVSRNAQ